MKKEEVAKMAGRMSRKDGVLDIVPIRQFDEKGKVKHKYQNNRFANN
tara:strand:+ start:365 stop:505 length:141 start_codon:yes stop_codon:yes gene_type:complete